MDGESLNPTLSFPLYEGVPLALCPECGRPARLVTFIVEWTGDFKVRGIFKCGIDHWTRMSMTDESGWVKG